MRFGILGPLDVRSATGETIQVSGPRPRALLVMLLLDAGHVVSVDRLIDGQYGDEPPADAIGALQAQVSRLRRSLPSDLVEFHGTGYRLAVAPDDVDAHRFERLAREGRRLLTAGRHDTAASLLREALGLWRGPALADLPSGGPQVARLEELRLAASEDLAEAELALPEGTSVAELRRLVEANPLRERLTAQLMRALHAAGRPAEALEVYENLRRVLAEQLGTDPSPELAAVHLAVLRAESPAPPARQGLHAQLTSFVGREQELRRIDALGGSRLVTIIGPGGIGKTRLAIEAAGRGPHEVCFADLSPLDGGDQVPQAILGALGLRETGLQPLRVSDPVERLVTALAGQELLLVLDNCEHVITAAATLTRRLLGECPGLRVLATSREPLGITGETLVPLAPLPVPPAELTAYSTRDYPAVRLFAERAAAVRQGFELGPDTVEAVTRICAALDGVPLAIELAAARLRSFTVEEIAARLAEDGRFRLLSRGDRTAAARHRTLHAVVEWSWDLLTPGEQALARRFAVFAGGASLSDVEAVCGLDDAADLLADLVDKSLVETDGDRYRMLETILFFCAERLADAGEQELLRRAHARYFLDLAQRADPHLRRAEQLEWLARLSAEHSNLMAALRWSVRDDRETALRLITALAAYCWLSGRRGQVGAAAAELLQAVPEPAEGLEEEYVMCVLHAVPRAGSAHRDRAEGIMRTLGRPLRYPFTAALWGMAAGPSVRQNPDAGTLLGTDPWLLALVRLGEALLKMLAGEPAASERGLLDVLAEFRGLGERWGTAQALDSLAQLAGRRGEWTRAHDLWREALELLEQLGALDEMVDVLSRRAECLVREGRLAEAAADYRRAAELSRRAGQPDEPAEAYLGLGEIARLEGDPAEARRLLEAALAASSTGAFWGDGTRARVLTALARLAEAEGRTGEARLRYGEALAVARRLSLHADLADAAEGQAGVALLAPATGPEAEGERTAGERAALLLGVAVALRGTAVTGDPDVARITTAARDRVGAEAFASAYSRGAGMRREDALAVLLDAALPSSSSG
ncbi:BTAD domain-containing putative transcriptional regulator [Sphaerisporangium fuscum]|uniref:BTAD domain-containing putative transcriptional regulator n=1 Tax=Sphaerisporangium fuscum TaxID=2835868 RepID=UPI001BDD0F5C|nr:BTAD domain-containing putative transcriptional regulator [Sphaerisporangium fuscum]